MGRVKRRQVRRQQRSCCFDGLCFRDARVQVSDPELQRMIDGCTPEEKCYFVHLLMARGIIGGGKVQLDTGELVGTFGARPPGDRYPG